MASKYSMNDRPSWPRRAIVTAGEPYGNKGLHFGHVGGVFVPADFFARFLRDRLGRENVIFTSGTDCYGSPIMESYRKLKENEGYDKSIGEYVESNHSRQAATLNNYNISCDIYGGSGLEPAAQIHNEVTAEIIERLHEQGTISKRSTLQFYDAKAGTFLNGRQVIGRCPIQGCKSEKAYADECDLGHQFEPEELIAPKSQLTGEVPELRPVDNLYFDLPAYLDFMKTYTAKLAQNPQVRSVVSRTMEEWLLPAQLYIQNKFREAFDAVEDQLPEHTVLEPEGNKSSFTVTFPSWKERDDAHAVLANGGVRFRSGKALVPFRITGNIDWGVPVPEVDGVNDVTCWCWPESLWAPISYTRTVLARDAKAAGVTEGVAAQDAALMGEPSADSTQVPAPTYQHSSLDWRDWWCSDDAQIYQFIGQDNIYFYCIAQTAMWEALGWNLTQSTVSACYHLLYMGKKASSSSQTPPPPADDLLNHYTCEQMRAHWLSLGLSEKPVSFSPKAYDTRVTGKDKDGNEVRACDDKRVIDPALKESALLTGVFNRRYFETEFCTRLDEWTDAHRCASLALVALDDEDGMRARQGDAVMNQLVCFVANQWKKHYDRPAERVVCRLTDTLFAIGCADKNCAELAEELNGIYAEMPRACVASVGLMRRVPFTQSIGCACTGEVRGKNWDALYQLCEQRLKAAQTAGGDQICSK